MPAPTLVRSAPGSLRGRSSPVRASLTCRHSLPLAPVSLSLILPPALGRGRFSLRAATTFCRLRPQSLVAPLAQPIGRRRLTPSLGAGWRTDRAQSAAAYGKEFAVVGLGFPEPPQPLLRQGLALSTVGGFSYHCWRCFPRHHRFWNVLALWGRDWLFGFLLVPPPIGAGSVVARCPCRAPGAGVLPAPPVRTRLKALPFGRRVVLAFGHSFFFGYRSHLRAAFSMVSP